MTRNEILMQARMATESAPISEIRYTDREAAEQEKAYSEAISALWKLSRKWGAENRRQREIRLWLEAQAAKRWPRIADRVIDGPEIVTSAPAEPQRETPFPLTRVALRSKVAKRRIPALGNFFQAAALFLANP